MFVIPEGTTVSESVANQIGYTVNGTTITANADKAAKIATASEEATTRLNEQLGKDNVARIGSTPYKTFEDALEAAKDNDVTITLLADVDLTSKYSTDEGKIFNLNGAVLDLNGHKIISNNNSIQFRSGGDGCTIKNGKFEVANAESYALFLDGSSLGGIMNIDNVTTIGGISVYDCGNVILNNVNSIGTNYYSVWTESGSLHGTIVTIKSGNFSSKGNYVIYCEEEYNGKKLYKY